MTDAQSTEGLSPQAGRRAAGRTGPGGTAGTPGRTRAPRPTPPLIFSPDWTGMCLSLLAGFPEWIWETERSAGPPVRLFRRGPPR